MAKYMTALKKRGITATVVDGKLRLTPKAAVTVELWAKIKNHLADILAELAGPSIPCPSCKELVPLQIENSSGWAWYHCQACDASGTHNTKPPRPYHLIASRLLGETIAVGRDWPREYVGYTWAEIENLKGAAPEMVQSVHRVKKEFPGCEVVARDGLWWEKAEKQLQMEAA